MATHISQLPEDRFEELVPPVSRAHDRLVRRLEAILASQLGMEYELLGPGVGLGIAKEPFTYRVPDKMVFLAGVDGRSTDPLYVWETPVLIAECLSPANRKSPVEELLGDYRPSAFRKFGSCGPRSGPVKCIAARRSRRAYPSRMGS